MRGPLPPSEPQAEHVGHVPSFWSDERTPPQIGQEDVDPPLAGRLGLAPLTSVTCSGGGGGGSASPAKEGTAPPTNNGLIVIRGARAGLSRSGQESHRTSAQCHDSRRRRPSRHREWSPRHTNKHLPCSVRAFLHLLRFPPVRSPDRSEEAHVPGIGAVLRERSRHDGVSVYSNVAWDSAVSWGNVVSAVRPRSASESCTVQISSLTSSCTASVPRRSASIAERESVATGTRVGDRDAAALRGNGKCL
ncbi:hypothetical protein MOQ_007366, partial [Trypanosoma cruzi marinkellei]